MFDELHEDLKTMQLDSLKEAEYHPGSYMDILIGVSRYVNEAQAAITAARKSLEDLKGTGAYRTSEQIKQMIDIVEKSLTSMSNIVSHTNSTLKKLGA